MQTVILRIEDSAIDKVMWMLEHLKDVVKIERYKTLEDELLEDLDALKHNNLKTTRITDIDAHIQKLKNANS